ncbi:MAG TPA: hypothetical protein VF375_02965 [Candidatus Limnocylindrales bacterium]
MAKSKSPQEPSLLPEPAPRRSSHRIGRREQLIGLILIVVVVAGTAFVGLRLLGGSATTAAPLTIWQKITAGIRDTGVPKDTALQAFSYLYRVSIPGVTVPDGVAGSDYPTSGSGAMRWVQANWNTLTTDQQAVINRYLVPGPNDIIVPLTDAPTGDVSGGLAGGADPRAPLAAPVAPGAVTTHAAPGAPAGLEAAMNKDLMADIAHIGARLNMPILTVGNPFYPRISLDLSPLDGGLDLLVTHAWMDHGFYEPCTVTAWKNSWQNEQVTSSGGVSPALHAEITHEVIHCYQNVIWGDPDTSTSMASWITEGSALWLAADDTQIEEPMLASTWANGYFKPEIPLTNRSYDAFGYYSLLDYTGRDLWSLMKPGWTAAATQLQRSNAFIAVLRGDDQDIRDSWATSYLRQTNWGAPWIMHGFGLPDTAQVVRHPIQAQADPGYDGSLQGRANTVLNVTASAGEVVTITTTGLASVHDDPGNNTLSFQTEKFCASGECVCPTNTPRAGQKVATKKLTIPFVLALNSPFGGSTYNVVGRKLEDECGRKATPPPAGRPCTGKCANSNGDPHLLTVNNYRYDFQGAGEFTLLRSADKSLEIQARQEPYTGNGVPRVATNTALAAKVGAHRVGVYVSSAGLTATLDGSALDITKTTDLGGGAHVAPYTGGLEIDFPDGTRLWALSVGAYGINTLISPSDSLRASGVGLLGPITPGGMGVPALPDGTQLAKATDKHQRHSVLYGQFADAWRVTDSTTLFDYAAGKSTTTYTQKGFPSETADIVYSDLSAEQRDAGAAACSSVTDQQLKDDCVFDVGVSGQIGFADGYVAEQPLFDIGMATPSELPTSSSSVTASPGTVTGAIALTQAAQVGGAVVGPDGKLYFSIALAGGKASLLEVDPATGTIIHQVDIPKTTRIHVAAGSVWAPGLIVDSRANNCSVTRFDAQTLVQQATVPIPCAAFGPTIVSDGQAIWYEDTSKFDSDTGNGAQLVRIDPATNKPGTSVPLPYINGLWLDSQGALFVWDPNKGTYGLTTGGTAMDSYGKTAQVFAAGTGFWVQSANSQPGSYYTHPGTPDATVTIKGSLVGGEATAAYVDDTGANGTTQLLRYPADGSGPVAIGTAPTIGDNNLGYYADPLPLPAQNGVVKYWLLTPSGATTATIYLQWMPLP